MKCPLLDLHKKVMDRIRDERLDLVNRDQLEELQRIYDQAAESIRRDANEPII